MDMGIRAWSTIDGTHLRTLNGHTGGVYALALSGDGARLCSGSADETIRIWNTSDGFLVTSINTGAAMHSLAFSADGQQLYSGSDSGKVLMW